MAAFQVPVGQEKLDLRPWSTLTLLRQAPNEKKSRTSLIDHTVLMMPNDLTAPAGALDAQMSTFAGLAAVLCGDVQASEGSLRPASGASARLAEEADWPKLRELWAEHHHLLEMVYETSFFVFLGPPAWAAVLTALLGFYLKWKGLETLLLRVSLVYALLAVLQHFLHWILANLILTYDLRYGELTAHGWKAKGSKGQPSAVIVVESPRGDLLGVLCVRTSLRSCCRRRRRRVTSLWHATVRPEARNAGVCGQLLRRAEQWAEEVGAQELEAVCLNPAAKAACWNMALELQNPKTGRWPLIPAFFSKSLQEMTCSFRVLQRPRPHGEDKDREGQNMVKRYV